jgi:uncharacterized protein (DUF608 family)
MANKKNVQWEWQVTYERSQTNARKKASQVERQKRFWEKKRQWLKEERKVVNVPILGEDYLQVVNLERSTTKAAKRIVGEWYVQIASKGVKYQCMDLPKILKHSIWKGVVPNYSDMEYAFNVVSNISQGWQ